MKPKDDVSAEGKRSTPLVFRLFKACVIAAVLVLMVGVVVTLPLRWINPPTTAFILADESPTKHTRTWYEFEDISQDLFLAVVAAEDQKFPIHHGFDLDAITDAMNEDRSRRRGASTITQQLAKNLYLWPGRSLFRKGIEAYLTGLLELFLPKRRILEIYVNVIEYGNGIYGIGAGTSYYFGKRPAQLTRREAALLAAVLPNPKQRSPSNPSAYVSRRAGQIELMMRQLGRGYLQGI